MGGGGSRGRKRCTKLLKINNKHSYLYDLICYITIARGIFLLLPCFYMKYRLPVARLIYIYLLRFRPIGDK